MGEKFIISVIIPIYNTEKYLQESIESIIHQTIGFEDNIQLILVNDASNDNSESICIKYKELYPKNIIYICQSENQGVSVARNEGMKYATGKYITFFDSDDLWSINAFQRAVEFFEINGEEIDLVSVDAEIFDAISNMHILNQKLNCDEVIEIHTKYYAIRTHGPSCIMRKEIVDYYLFNEGQKYWEDALFINQIILRKKKYGMLASDVKYYYRKRRENNSATQQGGQNKKTYSQGLKLLFDGVYYESIKQSGCFIPMEQYLIAYALAYRFQEDIRTFTEEELKHYDSILDSMMPHIDDKYILEVPNADEITKKVMVAYKHGVDLRYDRFQWKNFENQNKSISQRINRTTMNYDILKQWFILKMQGKSLVPYFEENGYGKIAVYGMSDLGQFLFEELKHSDIKVLYAIDRRADKLSSEVPLITIDDEMQPVDVCIITAVYYFNQIADELQNKLDCPIISIEDVLYSIS